MNFSENPLFSSALKSMKFQIKFTALALMQHYISKVTLNLSYQIKEEECEVAETVKYTTAAWYLSKCT